jgi:hypothetical protein
VALSVLALTLAGWYSFTAGNSTSAVPSTFHFVQDRPGPDSPSRNRPTPTDIWEGHGH